MRIRFGYVAIAKTLGITSSHTITFTNYQKLNNKDDKLFLIVSKNLDSLEEILKYNVSNNIHFYRMSSSIFPLATHPSVDYDVLSIFKDRLINIGNYINDNNLRVDIHLDHFCILNSINSDVVRSTINIINFYKNMFEVMNLKSKMIIHIGSSVGGKEEGINRFIDNFKLLDKKSQSMLVVENDDKTYNVKDTLYLARSLNIPMVLDYHHFMCNNDGENVFDFIDDIFATWDITPKIHFSSPKSSREKCAHHDYINVFDFIYFLSNVNGDFDVMIEAKEKDFALFKLVRELRYHGYNFIDDTTLEI